MADSAALAVGSDGAPVQKPTERNAGISGGGRGSGSLGHVPPNHPARPAVSGATPARDFSGQRGGLSAGPADGSMDVMGGRGGGQEEDEEDDEEDDEERAGGRRARPGRGLPHGARDILQRYISRKGVIKLYLTRNGKKSTRNHSSDREVLREWGRKTVNRSFSVFFLNFG